MEKNCKNCKYFSPIEEVKHFVEITNEPNIGIKHWIHESDLDNPFYNKNGRFKLIETKLCKSGFGNCSCNKFLQEGDVYNNEYTKRNGYIVLTKDNDEFLLSASYSDSDGHFQPGENFGCIHFEEKEL